MVRKTIKSINAIKAGINVQQKIRYKKPNPI